MLVLIFTLLLFNFYGEQRVFAYDIIGISILISIPILFIQYPILNWKANWIFRSLIFYASMLLFLFLFGILISWDSKVGSNNAGTWLARIDGGFRLVIFGQFFGGILGFVVITFFNFLFREKIFNRTKASK